MPGDSTSRCLNDTLNIERRGIPGHSTFFWALGNGARDRDQDETDSTQTPYTQTRDTLEWVGIHRLETTAFPGAPAPNLQPHRL